MFSGVSLRVVGVDGFGFVWQTCGFGFGVLIGLVGCVFGGLLCFGFAGAFG